MMPQLRSLPAQPVIRDIYRAYPATCKPLGEFTEAAMRGPSPFAQGQRELIAAYVSGLNACTYCRGTHRRRGGVRRGAGGHQGAADQAGVTERLWDPRSPLDRASYGA
jgi:AhpD family alkylhydroperoxidase